MKISIVVPAFNEEKLLPESLRHILQASRVFDDLGWSSELIVCDNNSSDLTATVARSAGAIVVFEPVNQIGRARNRGATAATGDWLIFIDADSRPTPALFRAVAEQIRSGQVLAGGATVRMDQSHWLGNRLVRSWNLLSRLARWMAGSFIFCETTAFRDVGGFSHELFASEEIDLSRRLKKLARERKRKIVILHRHPLLTSARKLSLYSRTEHLRFFGRWLLRPRRTLRRRDSCPTWYDGRR